MKKEGNLSISPYISRNSNQININKSILDKAKSNRLLTFKNRTMKAKKIKNLSIIKINFYI